MYMCIIFNIIIIIFYAHTHTHKYEYYTHIFTPSLIPPLLQHQDLLLRVHVIDFHLKCH